MNKYFPDENEFLENIRTAGQKLQEGSDEIVELKEKGVAGAEVLEAKEEFEDAEKAFLKVVGDALVHEDEEIAERAESVESTLATNKNLVLIVVIVTFILSIALGLFVSSRITKPLSQLSKTVDEVSKGNFNVEIEKTSSIKEINDLADSLDRIMKTMKVAVMKMREKKEEKK